MRDIFLEKIFIQFSLFLNISGLGIVKNFGISFLKLDFIELFSNINSGALVFFFFM